MYNCESLTTCIKKGQPYTEKDGETYQQCKHGPLILLEGLDLAGKSTLAERLRGALADRGVKLRHSQNCLVPENPVNAAAQSLRKLKQPGSGISLLETGSLFLASHLWDVTHFRPPPPDTVHLQESSWLRTVAYHAHNRTEFVGDPAVARQWASDFKGDFTDLVKAVLVEDSTTRGPDFDLVIYLTADVGSRRERLLRRQRDRPEQCDYDDALVVRQPERFAALDALVLEATRQRFPHVVPIDTTLLSAEQVFDEAVKLVCELFSLSSFKVSPLDYRVSQGLRLSQPAEPALDSPSLTSAAAPSQDLDEVPMLVGVGSHARRANILIVGVGPHARRVYIPGLLEHDPHARLALGVDIESQRASVERFLSGQQTLVEGRSASAESQQSSSEKPQGFKLPMLYIAPFDTALEELPPEVEERLTEEVKRREISAVIISTEPLVHHVYALWALKRGLHILLDKPISTRTNAACDLDAARGIWTDFNRLLRGYWEQQALGKRLMFSVNVQRRYHQGFQYVLKVIQDVSEEHQQPVTAVHCFHSDGQHRLPEEMKTVTYHSFNQGHGKISHSGYHLIDTALEFYKAGVSHISDSRKVAKSATVSCAAVQPQALARLQTAEDWSRVFPGYKDQLQFDQRALMTEFQSGYGEVDAQLQLTFEGADGINLALGSISLIHNGFSRRAWLEPSADLYKQNGRVKHEHYIIEQGPYQCIHIHSYQANDKHNEHVLETNTYTEGGDKHFDVHIYRNVDLFQDKSQPVLRKLSYPEIRLLLHSGETTSPSPMSHEDSGNGIFYLPSETSKRHVITEFVRAVQGILPTNSARSHICSHADSVRIMSSAYESLVLRCSGDKRTNPVVWFPLTTIDAHSPQQDGAVEVTSAAAPVSPGSPASGPASGCATVPSSPVAPPVPAVVKALAQGFLDGGAEFAINYPGWHSHEILAEMISEAERLQARLVNGGMALNEKVAYQQAFGASLAGLRSVVTLKNYGLSVAADPFLNSHLTGVNAGMVVVVTDDMEVIGSQGRQDSRFYRGFQGGLWLEPDSLAQAYGMAQASLQLSEQLDLPVIIRLTNAHFEWCGDVEGAWVRAAPRQAAGADKMSAAIEPLKFVVHPDTWRDQHEALLGKRAKAQAWVDSAWGNDLEGLSDPDAGSKILRLRVGAHPWALPALAGEVAMSVSTYPLPSKLLAGAARFQSVIVEENGEPYALQLLQLGMSQAQSGGAAPKLCAQAPPQPDHSARVIVWGGLSKLYGALAAVRPRHVVADLGQSTRETTSTVTSCLCLGSAVAVAWGAALCGADYPFCVSGDAALLHGGGRSLLDEVAASGAGMCVVIIDNGGSASTGGQAPLSGLLQHLPVATQHLNYEDTSKEAFRSIFEGCLADRRLHIICLFVR